jgi:curved DNA-binding protein CbpA
VLGVKPGASVQDIKKAHRVLTRKFHPDVPGGSKEKFQEVQDAYEQLKTGVWVKKGGNGDANSGQPQNRYAGFRFTQGHSKSKKSYQDVYTTMHTNKSRTDDGEDEEPIDAKKSPFGPNSVLFQAWFRLIAVWSCAFVVLRIGLFLIFPPKHERAPKRQMSDRPKKPPPPKPLAPTTAVLG